MYVHVKDSYMNEEDEQEHAMIGDGEHTADWLRVGLRVHA